VSVERDGAVAAPPGRGRGEPAASGLVELRPEPPRGKARARYEEGTNFGAVLRATQGHRDDLPPPPDFEGPPADLAERARRALYDVADPEFPISLVDLGLVYGVEADEETGRVTVRMTFTAMACPCVDFIKWDVVERLEREPGVEEVEVETVWDPPWTTERITERGRERLRRAGVSI